MRQKQDMTYCDETCKCITMTGTWTKTKKGAKWCSTHYRMVSTCQNCRREFHSHRVHAKTCSDKCRQALSRKSRKTVQEGSVTC